MAVIKNLYNNQLPNAKGVLYTAPGPAVVLGIDLVNTDGVARVINLYFKIPGGTSRRIIPKDLSLASGYHYPRTGKITMAAGDMIEGDASAANVVDTVISGVEI